MFGPHITAQLLYSLFIVFPNQKHFDQFCSVDQLVRSPAAKPSGQLVISEPAKNPKTTLKAPEKPAVAAKTKIIECCKFN